MVLKNASEPVPDAKEATRRLTGLYLDEAVNLDDPYRYYQC